MNKEILLKVLQLDSILEVLQWEERMMLHNAILDKNTVSTQRIRLMGDFVEYAYWEAPKMKIGQDRLKYCLKPNTENEYITIEEYRSTDEEFKQLLNHIS